VRSNCLCSAARLVLLMLCQLLSCKQPPALPSMVLLLLLLRLLF
jgi:hypothetical protein